ncbi:WXG100 family type VII secretion target [Streptomyces sp. BE230]|uniref:WXG100 family type VII secretion target n=1 Tax=Streptomyces sp. BE230 TaxID=3002526 RepID=UPI002ED186EE|nr:WXG100 family type VII secretion target [Streptomyces sp. BE230]
MGKQLPPLNACYNTSDFEHASYQDMLNMVSGVDAAAIMARGTALVDAQTEIEKIGTELKAHVGRTTGWKGAGGDAFREWGDGFAKETLKLADYAGTAGTSLQTAGQALSEVAKVIQGHPDAVSMCYADEAKEKARLKAVETARNEAIPQMNKLASYYLMAQQSISSQEEPNFKPLPTEIVPDRPVDNSQTRYSVPRSDSGGADSVAGAQNGGASAVDHQYSTVRPDGVSPSSPDGTPTIHTPQHVNAVPGAPDNTGTNIDTVTMPQAPPTTTTPPTGGFPPQGPTGGGHQTPLPPVVMPTRPGPFGPGDSIGRITPTGPGGKGPVDSVRPPVITPGRGGVESVRPPMTTRTDTGIHGGTPAQGKTGPIRGTSRGLVVGGERQATGHGMMGGSTGGHSGSVGRPNGLGGSQRLVTEPGGTVRTPRGTQSGAGREFTQGGAGLVRESPRSGGAMGPMGGAMGGSQGTGRRSQRRDGESPDYLAEDEETWRTGDNGVVPPVID